MKTNTAVRTTACAACCGLAGVGAFLSAPSHTAGTAAAGRHPTHNTCWGNSALSSPLSLVGDGSRAAANGGAPRASMCPPGNSNDDADGGESGAAGRSGRVGSGGNGGGGGSRRGKRHRAATLGNLDLKPAYRLFDTVPPAPTDEVARKSDDIDLDVDGKAPYGKRRSALSRAWGPRAGRGYSGSGRLAYWRVPRAWRRFLEESVTRMEIW